MRMTDAEKVYEKTLIKNNINYNYPVNLLEFNGTRYRPDFYLPESNTYVEVVGTRQAYSANKKKYKLFSSFCDGINNFIIVDKFGNPYISKRIKNFVGGKTYITTSILSRELDKTSTTIILKSKKLGVGIRASEKQNSLYLFTEKEADDIRKSLKVKSKSFIENTQNREEQMSNQITTSDLSFELKKATNSIVRHAKELNIGTRAGGKPNASFLFTEKEANLIRKSFEKKDGEK